MGTKNYFCAQKSTFGSKSRLSDPKVDFLDHVTLRDYVSDDQPCKIMRADFGGVDLVGIKGARISGALKGHPREEGSNFGVEHGTQGRGKGQLKR